MPDPISPSESPALDISGLSFSYPGTPEPVVQISKFSIDAGEQVLLTGGSGLGKSTLLQLIAGLLDPGRGDIRVAGEYIHAFRGAARDRFRGQHIGMIFQTFNLLHGFTAIENVMAALMFSDVPKGEHRGRAGEALEHLGIDRKDAQVSQLSVGQQQRVAVARAVVCHPSLVLADEPTASLDPENASRAIDLIRRACCDAGAALLCVSHDPAMTDHFERCESLAELSADSSAHAGRAG